MERNEEKGQGKEESPKGRGLEGRWRRWVERPWNMVRGKMQGQGKGGSSLARNETAEGGGGFRTGTLRGVSEKYIRTGGKGRGSRGRAAMPGREEQS